MLGEEEGWAVLGGLLGALGAFIFVYSSVTEIGDISVGEDAERSESTPPDPALATEIWKQKKFYIFQRSSNLSFFFKLL